jgi:hypothetical protein
MNYRYIIIDKFGSSLTAYGESHIYEEKTSRISIFSVDGSTREFQHVVSFKRVESDIPPSAFFFNGERFGPDDV